MTDVIGWGDVAAEARRPRRRPPRWVRVGVGLAAVAAVAAVAATPPVQRRLGDRAAAWIAARWSEAQALDGARSAVIYDVGSRIGVADQPILDRASGAADLETANRLSALDRRIREHRMWTGDVRAAADAVRDALRAEVRDLRREAADRHPATFNYLRATGALIDSAARRITALLAHHHVAASRPTIPPLTAADADLRLLSRPTDRPIHLGIAIASDGQPMRVIDLDTGVTRRYPGVGFAGGASSTYVVGSRLLVQQGGRFELLGLGGATTVQLPKATDYEPAGGDGWWQLLSPETVRRIDADGRPVSAVIDVPRGFQMQAWFATPDALAITAGDLEGGSLELWHPLTGSLRRLPISCAVAVSNDVMTAVACPGHHVVMEDLAGGPRRELPVPSGYRVDTGNSVALSADASRFAVDVVARTGGSSVMSVDLRTGRFDPVPDSSDLAPLEWSRDGQWLLLGPTGGTLNFSGTKLSVALWHPGDDRLTSLRLQDTNPDVRLALLP